MFIKKCMICDIKIPIDNYYNICDKHKYIFNKIRAEALQECLDDIENHGTYRIRQRLITAKSKMVK